MTADRLSLVFGALADPTRRAILTRLTEGDATVAELAAPFSMSQPAISRHLKVLENAGLVSRTRRATARLSHLEAEPLREVTTWLARYQRFWDESHERLDELLAALQAGQETAAPRTRPERRETTMSKTQITAEPGIPQIIITREFDAPRDLVFRAYTDPELLVQWLGPRDLTMTIDQLRRPRRRHLALRPHRRRRQRATASTASSTARRRRRASCRPSSSRACPATSPWRPLHFERARRQDAGRARSRAFQSVEDRDAMVASGMERGVRDSDERLDELLAKLQAS